MVLHDYECTQCGNVDEELVEPGVSFSNCSVCGSVSKKVFLKMNSTNDNAEWLKSVVEVVDKDGDHICQDFIRNPSRGNYQRWMKSRGLRPLEDGEIENSKKERKRKLEQNRKDIRKKVMDKHRERNSITI